MSFKQKYTRIISGLAIAALFFIISACGNPAPVTVADLMCDNRTDPAGVGERPAFSWILMSDQRNQYQSAYRALIADDPALLRNDSGNIWDSKKVDSDQSLLIPYSGRQLSPGTTYYWKVKVWDKNGEESQWSEVASFTTALFEENDWSGAEWIRYETMHDSLILVPGVHPWGKDVSKLALRKPTIPLFRKDFNVKKEIRSATLFVSGLGHYKAYINGRQVSDDFLSPGWTDYQKRRLYNVYDVTQFLQSGDNAIGVIVGSGFYNVHNERYRKLLITYGMPKMIGKLQIRYNDGTVENITSGEDWKTAPSPYVFSTIYGGETYDARLEQEGWNEPRFDDGQWRQALVDQPFDGRLLPETTHPVKVIETFRPEKVTRLDSANYLYDFGQNASGIIRLKVKGRKGKKVKLIPGELLDENGHVAQGATGKPYYWEYILKGDGDEIWQPQFTYYGFRYLQVEGATSDGENSGKPEVLELTSLHTRNSAPDAGEFSSSNELFNRIDKLIRYAIQSNFQSVLTDCPHREKLGWLEQTYLMGGSVHYNFDVYHLYRKLVRDMAQAQRSNGLIPSIAPEFTDFGGDFTDSPEWGSAGIMLPWLIYKWYGDTSVMKEAWPMMQQYLAYLQSRADGHILSHGLGDWYDLGPERPGYSQLTPKGLTATATYYYNAKIMAEMAAILKRDDDCRKLAALAEEIKTAFNNKFYNTEGKIYATGSQTSMAMPLSIGLVNESDRDAVFQNLVDSIRNNGKALTAGDIGFHYLVDALTENGGSQLFYEMNNRDDVPGYGYQLKKGATALTESWQALEGVSNNHLMLGHIMEWFYKGLGGIRQADASAAYKTITIKPDMVGDLTEVKTSYRSPYGLIRSEWQKTNTGIQMLVEVPVNASALVCLPADDPGQITESGHPLAEVEGIKIIDNHEDELIIRVGSGIYRFEARIE